MEEHIPYEIFYGIPLILNYSSNRKTKGTRSYPWGDLNEHTLSKKNTVFSYLGMRERIIKINGKKSPSTKISNKRRQPIDGIWGTTGINILEGGYLLFNQGP